MADRLTADREADIRARVADNMADADCGPLLAEVERLTVELSVQTATVAALRTAAESAEADVERLTEDRNDWQDGHRKLEIALRCAEAERDRLLAAQAGIAERTAALIAERDRYREALEKIATTRNPGSVMREGDSN